ncbi:UvrD-helicase domain-containing protein [Prochlorococcus marinus]|uniref:DNA 3'-5' helicase n=1 Tax=Prochlorococcus marinus XMU1408 TaxID=2213228 RepID=A0A318R300_PROMR|nr:UvrD-helicase domain-containing protein [Prochlorococcus marinus]MBW3042251.1 AAA family ATPase [Prochlorococcus marinus str. XMU1408]PYE01640.1 AAA family ATPase [Prochlorococcus marinus XMU1408]
MNNVNLFQANKYPLTNGMRLIEASAGTGKTFSLSHLFLRLLTEKEYSINEILVVSFTEATASEIKAKIIERLILALKIIESKYTNVKQYKVDKVLNEWVELNITSKDRALHFASLLLEALERIDNADITTIHGFCSKTLRREAIENGNNVNPTIEKDSNSLINEIVEEYWKKEILEIDISELKGIFKTNFNRKNLIQVLNALDNDVNNIFKHTFNELKIDESLSNQLNNYIQSLWIDFRTIWKEKGKELENSFIDIAKNLKSQGIADTKPYSSKPRKNRHELLSNWIEEYKEKKRPSYEDIQKQDLINKYFHPKNLYQLDAKYKIDLCSKDIKPILDIIGDLYDSPGEFVWEHALLWTKRELKERKSKKGMINYSDLLKSLDPKNLNSNKIKNEDNSNDVYKNLKLRYKVALIDEFQDTDQVQLRLLNEAFGNRSTHLLLMIGDPKQAIYSFRGGSLNTYMKARETCDRIDLMNANYRSTKSLILILNKLFLDGLIRSNLSTQELNPCSQEDLLKLKGIKEPFKIINLIDNNQKDKKQSVKLESKSKIENKIPKILGSYLLELLSNNSKDINPSDICILVNRHDQAKNIHTYLSKINIPSQLSSNENIFTREGAQILQIFINCIVSPYNQQKLSLLACSELMQWKKEKLSESKTNGDFDSLSSKFNELAKLFPKVGLLGCLSNFLEGKSIADLSNRGTLLGDLYQSSQLVDEQIHRQKFSAMRASQWLSSQRFQTTEPIPEEYQPNSAISNSAVNIITIHKSKGLQFKIVICPYLWQKPPDKKSHLWKHNQNLFISKKYKWHKKYNSYQDLIKKESLNEAERLAYVALTRAKKQLIILWAKAAGQEGNPLSGFLFGSKSINLNIEDCTKEMMEHSFKERELKVDIQDIKLIEANRTWTQPKNEVKLSLGASPKHQFENSWGRYSFSRWITQQNNESIVKNFSDELNEDLAFKDQIEFLSSKKIDQILIGKDQSFDTLEDHTWSKESPIGDFPRGPIAGTCLHKILERVDFNDIENQLKISSIIKEELNIVNINNSFIEPINILLKRIANIPLGGPLGKFKMKNLNPKSSIKELKFDIPICHKTNPIHTLDLLSIFKEDAQKKYGSDYINKLMNLNIYSNGFLTGSIDQVFADNPNHEIAKWWVLDWKSNWIGSPLTKEGDLSCGPINYSISRMDEEMYHHHYPLQAHIYLLALHRFLNWRLPNYSPQKHLGGYIYVFLRGIPDNRDLEKMNYPQRTPGLIIEPAPLKRIKKLDLLIKKQNK